MAFRSENAKLIAVHENIHLIILERERPVLVGKQFHQRSVAARDVQVFLLGKFEHAALGEQVHTALADYLFLTGILAEER